MGLFSEGDVPASEGNWIVSIIPTNVFHLVAIFSIQLAAAHFRRVNRLSADPPASLCRVVRNVQISDQ